MNVQVVRVDIGKEKKLMGEVISFLNYIGVELITAPGMLSLAILVVFILIVAVKAKRR